jgi:hypothetical protein
MKADYTRGGISEAGLRSEVRVMVLYRDGLFRKRA